MENRKTSVIISDEPDFMFDAIYFLTGNCKKLSPEKAGEKFRLFENEYAQYEKFYDAVFEEAQKLKKDCPLITRYSRLLFSERNENFALLVSFLQFYIQNLQSGGKSSAPDPRAVFLQSI